MRRLGISIYPEEGNKKDIIHYIDLASKYGFERIFTCLISINGDKKAFVHGLTDLFQYAKSKGMQVIADVSPSVFADFHIKYDELKFFKDLGLYGIRLDLGFSGNEESMMTFNKEGLKIEINMSNGSRYLENILSYEPNRENLIGCHNFYPHRYTGLSRAHFMRTSKQFKDMGIPTAAFVSSNVGTIGPWPVSEGLCSLEEHRSLPMEVQAKDLFNTNLVDDVIIANCFASEEELSAMSELNKDILSLRVELEENTPELEKRIINEELHFNRGDVSEYMIRSTQSRVKFKEHTFHLFNPMPIKKGDVLIESSLYERYAGELQIALKPMENSGRTNVVGRIKNEEIFLIDQIKPWQKFMLKAEKSNIREQVL